MTAQSHPNILHPIGTSSVVRTIMTIDMMNEMMRETRKRVTILGTSCQKLERSTSFFVAPQVMLYEKRCASSACDK